MTTLSIYFQSDFLGRSTIYPSFLSILSLLFRSLGKDIPTFSFNILSIELEIGDFSFLFVAYKARRFFGGRGFFLFCVNPFWYRLSHFVFCR